MGSYQAFGREVTEDLKIGMQSGRWMTEIKAEGNPHPSKDNEVISASTSKYLL